MWLQCISKEHAMKPREKISKSSWTLLESIKDALATNVVNASRSGQLNIESSQLESLLMVLAASADEGYHRGHKSFCKTVDDSLLEVARDAELISSMPELSKSSSKKK